MKHADPARMSRDALLAEVGEILASGIQRFLANKFKPSAQPRNCEEQLDDDGDSEAPCGPPALEATT